MPGAQEILLAVRGALGLALGDKNALSNFDQSADGFFRSFTAFILALPFYLLIGSAEWRIIHEEGTVQVPIAFSSYMALKLAAAALSWALFPLAVAVMARPLGFARRYVTYIIAYNWAQLPMLAALTGPYLLYSLGLMPVGGTALLHLLLLIGILWYRWRIAMAALGATAGLAAGLVVLGITVELIVELGLRQFVN